MKNDKAVGGAYVLEFAEIAFVGAAAFAAAVLSAVVGMAGGITLLAVLLLFLPPLIAVPLHGVIQLASNGARAAIQWRHADLHIIWRYALPLIPCALLGAHFARQLPEGAARFAIGVFVLLATWVPGAFRLAAHATPAAGRARFLWLGGACGFLQMALGAVGPLLAPFFLRLGLSRQALIGTKAGCQMLGHLVKTAVFGGLGFAFAEHVPLLLVCVAAVVAGTWVGSRLLSHVSEAVFTLLYKGVLTVLALRLALMEVPALVSAFSLFLA